ncbi:MFS transporter [Muribaculaceae bacterium Isolate-039 (Harlan)]|jgi:maltose/moltooligosaccharide transporter|uniref:SLC45 family MFS transporter n=1 Tax=Duncaniella muris TaxID=2094150 RepID=UPI000F49AA3F|nr:SLC45 family MFS transporter [Duncaniella muris]ROS91712.1 MFS transporter [Muribaculaceae bacterium Isolate-039 (Harlan)]ROS97602.1 MFS transporter [Muribaculaceae bacterium Isolate-083 (Janvier)]
MVKNKPDQSFLNLWNLSFGFFSVQIAYALQSANISRIFATLGADPHSLSYFWILPPLMGIIVQPLVGAASDRTWNRLGRRLPYLVLGAAIAVVVMCLLPNAGSFGLTVGGAMIFGFVALMFLDTSINMAMQPFKMLVGDQVNERQKGLAYSIQSFLCNAGSLVGYLAPITLTAIGVSNLAPAGQVPDAVTYSFYIGAAVLILCVIYSFVTIREMPPKEYAEYHGITEQQNEEKTSMLKLLIHAPRTFWTVGLVQFFCWAAFLYMWTYTPGAIADTVWGTTDTNSEAYQTAGNWVGVLFAVQAVGSVLWAVVIPRFKSHKTVYVLSLLLGAAGFISTLFVTDQYVLFISFLLIGCAWAAMLALPFTILTNSISGKNMGTYLGLFNGSICVPQICAAALGGLILPLLGGHQVNMLVLGGVLLVAGALSVGLVKETYAEKEN